MHSTAAPIDQGHENEVQIVSANHHHTAEQIRNRRSCRHFVIPGRRCRDGHVRDLVTRDLAAGASGRDPGASDRDPAASGRDPATTVIQTVTDTVIVLDSMTTAPSTPLRNRMAVELQTTVIVTTTDTRGLGAVAAADKSTPLPGLDGETRGPGQGQDQGQDQHRNSGGDWPAGDKLMQFCCICYSQFIEWFHVLKLKAAFFEKKKVLKLLKES